MLDLAAHIRAAFGDEDAADYVVLAPDDLLFGERGCHIEDRGERLDIELDRAKSAAELRLVRTAEQKDRLIDMVDDRIREHRLIVDDHGDDILRHVRGADDGDVAPIERRIELDVPDAATGNRAAQRGAEDLARHVRQIIDVARKSRDLGRAVDASHALADT